MKQEEESSKARKAGESLRSGGTALAIPMVLVGPPLVFGYIASLLAGRWDRPWLTMAGVLVGLALGIYECVQLVKRISSDG